MLRFKNIHAVIRMLFACSCGLWFLVNELVTKTNDKMKRCQGQKVWDLRNSKVLRLNFHEILYNWNNYWYCISISLKIKKTFKILFIFAKNYFIYNGKSTCDFPQKRKRLPKLKCHRLKITWKNLNSYSYELKFW